MKTLIKIVIITGFISFGNAQVIERNLSNIIIVYGKEASLKMEDKLLTLNDFNIGLSPQFGNLFVSWQEAKKAKINLQDVFNDFDFGFNLDIEHKLTNNIDIKALYEIGMLKFNNSINDKSKSYSIKVAINYMF